MLIAMLDGLRQAHIWRNDQWGTTALARTERLTIGSFEDRGIAPPTIAAPVQWTTLRARSREGDRSLDEIVADAESAHRRQ